MKKLLAIIITAIVAITASAQVEHSIILDQSSFHRVHTDALTGVNIDPIAKDLSRNACARVKIRFANMNRAEIDALEVKFQSNTDLARQYVAQYYDNVLILEMTAKPNTRFYVQSPDYGQSNEVTLNLEGDTEYEMEARLNQSFSIIVNTNVAGAEVYIDGNFKGRTDSTNSCTVKEVIIGSHTLKLVYGDVTAEQLIDVNSSKISFRQDLNVEVERFDVTFKVHPATATITIDNGFELPISNGLFTIKLPKGRHSYVVKADKYHPQSCEFDVVNTSKQVVVTLKQDAATVTLTVPDNAEIWINGQKMGEGTWSGLLYSGSYTFEARKQGHKSSVMYREITSDRLKQSYAMPAPEPIYGSIMVDGTPLMADVTLDGKLIGQTPLKKSDILIGNYTLKISKLSYADKTQTITISEGETTTINVTLTKGGSNANIAGFDMVYVKGGTFTMGATAEQGSDADSDEKPTHSVTVSDFYIGKYEVTQAQWKAIMGINPSKWKGDNLPVEKVSWDDIQEFIKKLNAKTGKKFRLPTEAEWEYAARGGNKSKGYKYSGSNKLKNVAWYDHNSDNMTHPVGQKRPNELGIYDMSGNVWEWCQDWYGDYSSSSQTNPTGPSIGSYHVLRGGSWLGSAWSCRVSCRASDGPIIPFCTDGFRLALSVE